MGNPFVHIELNTTDLGKAKGFYGEMFDWTLKELEMPNGLYISIAVGGGTGGGMLAQTMPGEPSFWLPYVLVKDIEASTAQAKALGATVLKDVTQIADMGFVSIIRDPAGAMLGLWKFID